MRSGFEVRLLFIASVASITAAALVSACTEDAAPATVDAGSPTRRPRDAREDVPDNDHDEDDLDSGTPDDASITDARSDAATGKDANGPGEAGTECALNRECQHALRCECTDYECTCQPGPRGTGRNGIDTCDSGDQCASSICLEGPTDGEFICSDECVDAKDCVGKLPRCVPIALFPTPICVREPPK